MSMDFFYLLSCLSLKGSYGEKIQFQIIWKKKLSDFDWFFSKSFLMKNATKVTPVLRIMRVKLIINPVISLCPAHTCNCILQIMWSSNFLNALSTLTHRFICSNFFCQCSAFLSCCTCETPLLASGFFYLLLYMLVLKETWQRHIVLIAIMITEMI